MQVETLPFATIDGLTLVGDLALPASPGAGAVLAHPHPLYGGDRFNPVVDALFAALPAAGIATLRFDFRGVNDSEGVFDEGEGERLDVAAAVDLLDPLLDRSPLVAVGYSFGALVCLDVTDPRLAGWLAVAPPLGAPPRTPLAASDHRPKHLLVPAHDQFCPPAVALERTAGWTATTVETLPMGDHFLVGRTSVAARAAVEAVQRFTAGR